MTKSILKNTLDLLPYKAPAAMKDFAQNFLSKIPEEDLKQITAPVLAKTVETHWNLLKDKNDDKPRVKIYTPTREEDGRSAGRTIIDIVQDDMAFLIDSIVAEIVRHGQLIQMLVHPTMNAEMTNKGAIKGFKEDY